MYKAVFAVQLKFASEEDFFEKRVLTGDLEFREPQRRERAHACVQGRALDNP